MHLKFLRLFLGFAAVTWGVSIFGVVLPWSAASDALQGLGAQPIAYDRMLDYWLRMAAGAFTLVGGLFLLLMLWPARFRAIIPWFGVLMLVEGVILLIHGLRLQLPPLPFYADTTACLLDGAGILWLSSRADYDGGSKPSGRPNVRLKTERPMSSPDLKLLVDEDEVFVSLSPEAFDSKLRELLSDDVAADNELCLYEQITFLRGKIPDRPGPLIRCLWWISGMLGGAVFLYGLYDLAKKFIAYFAASL